MSPVTIQEVSQEPNPYVYGDHPSRFSPARSENALKTPRAETGFEKYRNHPNKRFLYRT
jgi:hypothetical protein